MKKKKKKKLLLCIKNQNYSTANQKINYIIKNRTDANKVLESHSYILKLTCAYL